MNTVTTKETKKLVNNFRTPPQNIDAERALLGSIMMRPVALLEIIDSINEDDFYVQKHKLIFRVMIELSRVGDPIDLVSVAEKLQSMNLLDQSGGISYLNDVANTVPNASNLEYYAKTVNGKSILRKLITAGDFVTQLGFEEASEVEEVLDKAEKKIFEITNNPSAGKKFISIKDIIPKSWEKIEMLAEGGQLRGVPTGYDAIDSILSGFQKSDLIILAARPSTGKTALALDIARKAAVDHNIPIGFFSLEMSADQLTDRMLSAESQVDSWRMRTGKGLTDDDFARISVAMETLSKAPIYIDDKPGNTILNMRSTARRLKAEHGLEIIFVDYMQLMNTSKRYDSMVNQVTEISRSLKSLARELDVPVVALSQLSRAVETRGGKPRLSDLRDSGSIEQDADVVMFLHKDRNEDGVGRSQITDILIEKHRNGAVGHCQLFFDEARTTFLTLDKTHTENSVDSLDNEF
ncbi:MAG: replicative DNA helicase [Candidatus Pacebacteria bacterium]|nr:replicative DNA helicase [Candidatus Paceibacterota bacterium]